MTRAGRHQPAANSKTPCLSDESTDTTGRFKHTPKSNPQPQTEAGGVDAEDLKHVVAQEMAQLKMFIKEASQMVAFAVCTLFRGCRGHRCLTRATDNWQVKGTKPGADSQMKTYYRDK